MDYLALLKDLAAKCTLTSAFPVSPLEPALTLTPPPALQVIGRTLTLNAVTQQITTVKIPLDIDLAFLGKWVRSATDALPADPGTEAPIGGMPISAPLAVGTAVTNAVPSPALMVSDPGSNPPGVPELLGRIKGTILQSVDKLQDVAVSIPVTLEFRLTVLDMSEPGTSPNASNVFYRLLSTDPWSALGGTITLAGSGAPAGSPPPFNVQLQFQPFFSELRSATPDVMTFSVRVSVHATLVPTPGAPAVDTGWIDLPPLPLVIPTIPVPTIVVLCEHRKFTGRKAVFVPPDSLLGSAAAGSIDIGTALSLTNSALSSLAPLSNLIGFLAAAPNPPVDVAANVLKSLVASAGQTIIAPLSRVDNLDTPALVFDPGGLLGIGRFTADNMASSIICIGRPGTRIEFDLDQNLSHRITPLIIDLDLSLGCAIHRLDRIDVPADVVYGGTVTSFSPATTFEDRISSLAFSSPATRFIPA